MAQISINNLTFSYDGSFENVFDKVSFSFDTNWKIGFVGRNGKGKTTLLKILQNKLEYSGNILSPVGFDYFPYEIKDKDKLAIDVLEQINVNYELWQVMKNMNTLELDADCLYKNYSLLSCGEQTKLLLAVLFTKQNNFLLIDEPTNHLDIKSRKLVCEFLNKQKGFIVVSHDRGFLNNCVDHIISINRANIEIVKGDFSSWWQNKQNSDNLELEQNSRLKKDIERLNQSVKRTENWANKVEKSKNGVRVAGLRPDKGYIGHKSAKMMQRAKAIEVRQTKAIEQKSKLLKNIDRQEDIFISGLENKNQTLVKFENVSIFYDATCIKDNINFEINNCDKIAVVGKNGCGKSSILKLIMGENINYSGKIYKQGGLKISYISQTFDELCGPFDEYITRQKIDKTIFMTYLIKLGFKREDFEKQLQNLSAGQKKKILIAKSLSQKANLYVWDEPLNYIDVISRIQIEEMLKQANLTIIFVEHDISFVENVSTKILEL